jgi:hypothetical protein
VSRWDSCYWREAKLLARDDVIVIMASHCQNMV